MKLANNVTPTNTFTGPNGTTVIVRQHSSTCDCVVCETARWQQIERQMEIEQRARDRQEQAS